MHRVKRLVKENNDYNNREQYDFLCSSWWHVFGKTSL